MSFPRYPKYRDSGVEWLGDVPEHWEIVPLKHVASLKGRLGWQGLRSDEYTDEGPYLVTSEHIESGRIRWERCYHVTPERFSIAPEIQLRQCDVLMMKDGAAMGKLAYVDYLPGPACLNSHLLLFRPLNARFENLFLFYVLGTEAFTTYMIQERTGTTFYGISQESIGAFPFAIPPKHEQHLILDFLRRETGKLDELIEEQRRLIELLKENRQAFISHAVRKGLNRAATMKESGVEWIGEIPVHWAIRRVGHLFDERDERSTTGQEEMLSVSHLTGVTRRSEKTVYMFEAETNEGYKLCMAGDLVVNTLWGWMGAMGTAPQDGMVSPAYNIYIPSADLQPDFVDAVVRTRAFVDEVTRYSKGVWSSRLRIYPVEFFQLSLPVPPPDEQVDITKAIGRVSSECDRLCREAEKGISFLQERRSALISAAVTGKIDVRQPMRKPVASARPYTSGFAHQLLAATILSRCNDSHMGRTKLQKLIHVAEHHAQIDELRGEYTRKMAGPLDMKAVQGLERGLEGLRWFKTVREADRNRYRYVPLEKHEQHNKYLERWADKQTRIDEVLTLMGGMTMRQCEIVSTLYAAWNDLLIDELPVTDDAILAQATTAEGWHENKGKTPREKWTAALQWMKDKGLVPTGFGMHTRKAKAENEHVPA